MKRAATMGDERMDRVAMWYRWWARLGGWRGVAHDVAAIGCLVVGTWLSGMGVFFCETMFLHPTCRQLCVSRGGHVGFGLVGKAATRFVYRDAFCEITACSGNFTVMQVADTTVHGAVH